MTTITSVADLFSHRNAKNELQTVLSVQSTVEAEHLLSWATQRFKVEAFRFQNAVVNDIREYTIRHNKGFAEVNRHLQVKRILTTHVTNALEEEGVSREEIKKELETFRTDLKKRSEKAKKRSTKKKAN